MKSVKKLFLKIGNVFSKMDKPLLVLSIIMYIIGSLMILSASYVKGTMTYKNPLIFFNKHSIILLISSITFLAIMFIPTKFYKNNIVLFILLPIGLLIGLFFWGITVNGAKSWYITRVFSLQPSEFSKLALIIVTAFFVERYKKTGNILNIISSIIIALSIAGLILVEPDFGTSIIVILLFMLVFESVKYDKNLRKILLIIYGICALFVGMIGMYRIYSGKPILNPSRMERLNLSNPCGRYTEVGNGYQMCNGYIAINSGGLFGKGYGNSTQKYLYLPEAHTDFIFPIILEELGLISGLIITILYFLILLRIYYVSKNSKSLMNNLIAYGVGSLIVLHVIINFFGVFGLLPLTGIPLPFLSYGGSFTLTITIGLALVQRISYENRVMDEKTILSSRIKGK